MALKSVTEAVTQYKSLICKPNIIQTEEEQLKHAMFILSEQFLVLYEALNSLHKEERLGSASPIFKDILL